MLNCLNDWNFLDVSVAFGFPQCGHAEVTPKDIKYREKLNMGLYDLYVMTAISY